MTPERVLNTVLNITTELKIVMAEGLFWSNWINNEIKKSSRCLFAHIPVIHSKKHPSNSRAKRKTNLIHVQITLSIFNPYRGFCTAGWKTLMWLCRVGDITSICAAMALFIYFNKTRIFILFGTACISLFPVSDTQKGEMVLRAKWM